MKRKSNSLALSLACALVICILVTLIAPFLVQNGPKVFDAQEDDWCTRHQIVIKILTFNRLNSLQRLLESLLQAHYPQSCQNLPIQFHIDAGSPDELNKYVEAFHWPRGPKEIHRRVVRAGLIAAVVESWEPANDNEYALILEDDLEVSPYFFSWIQTALDASIASSSFRRLFGISLYTPRVIEVVQPKRTYLPDIELADTPAGNGWYLHQLPCSWGALYFPHAWREFREYMTYRMQKPGVLNIPGSTTNGWQQSWKKFFIEMAWANGYFMVYPNFPNQTSFSTNHLEPGEHIQATDRKHKKADYTVPLAITAEDLKRVHELRSRSLDDAPILNLFNRRIYPTPIARKMYSELDCPLPGHVRGAIGSTLRQPFAQFSRGNKLLSGFILRTGDYLESVPHKGGKYDGYFFKAGINQSGNLIIHMVSSQGIIERTVPVTDNRIGAKEEYLLLLNTIGGIGIVAKRCTQRGEILSSAEGGDCPTFWVSQGREPSKYFLFLHSNGELALYHGCDPCNCFHTPVWTSNTAAEDFGEDSPISLKCDVRQHNRQDILRSGVPFEEGDMLFSLPNVRGEKFSVEIDRGRIRVSKHDQQGLPKSSRSSASWSILPHEQLAMQLEDDGQLVVGVRTDVISRTLWEADYHGFPPHFLMLNRDGRLRVYEGYGPCEAGREIYHSNLEATESFPPCPPPFDLQKKLTCGMTSDHVFNYFANPHQFTVVISIYSYSRIPLLDNLLRHVTASALVGNVIIVWHMPLESLPSNAYMNGKLIVFAGTITDSLNNRFMPDVHITTEAVLVMDDDMLLHPSDMERLFIAWKANDDKIVGFFPRWTGGEGEDEKYLFVSEDEAGKLGGYKIMLTKIMMLHKRYLYEYTCGYGGMFHDMVNDELNCEDLAMNYLVSLLSKGPSSIFVEPQYTIGDFGKYLKTGLQKRGNHRDVRSACLKTFSQYAGFSDGLPRQDFIARVNRDKSVHLAPYKGLQRRHYDCKYNETQPPCAWPL